MNEDGFARLQRARYVALCARRDEMIEWLRIEKHYTDSGAIKCADEFLDTMGFVLRETGRLP